MAEFLFIKPKKEIKHFLFENNTILYKVHPKARYKMIWILKNKMLSRIQGIDNQWKMIQDARKNGSKMQENDLRIKRQSNSHWCGRRWKSYLDLTHNTQSIVYFYKSPSNLECATYSLTTHKFHSNPNSHIQTSQSKI